MLNNRQHIRVPVQFRTSFSTKKQQMIAGDGELRDLSPGGCRVSSPVAVPVGTELECCIFPPEGHGNPLILDGATVRWTGPKEFGVEFTNVRVAVQRQVAQLLRRRAPL
ncbi:MAG TPA: PilZ domain-containing protein [Nitrospira sp.]|nr:PilZ domain-containing protein [Nitrospira sp.]